MPKIVELSHDGFSRTSQVREAVSDKPSGCDWCGCRRKDRKLFRYGTWLDEDNSQRRISWARGEFCCRSCCQAYHS